jgi:hypothetical protein
VIRVQWLVSYLCNTDYDSGDGDDRSDDCDDGDDGDDKDDGSDGRMVTILGVLVVIRSLGQPIADAACACV